MHMIVKIGDRHRHGTRHDAVHRLEHRDVDLALGGDGGDLQTNIAAAHDGELLARLENSAQAVDVFDTAQIMHAGEIGAGTADLAHAASRREQELVVSQRTAVGEMHLFRRAVDLCRGDAQDQFAIRLFVEGVGFQEETVALHRAHEIGLGERRPLIGREGLVADHGDRTGEAVGPQARDGLRAGLAGADDDDSLGHVEFRSGPAPFAPDGIEHGGDVPRNQPLSGVERQARAG